MRAARALVTFVLGAMRSLQALEEERTDSMSQVIAAPLGWSVVVPKRNDDGAVTLIYSTIIGWETFKKAGDLPLPRVTDSAGE